MHRNRYPKRIYLDSFCYDTVNSDWNVKNFVGEMGLIADECRFLMHDFYVRLNIYYRSYLALQVQVDYVVA